MTAVDDSSILLREHVSLDFHSETLFLTSFPISDAPVAIFILLEPPPPPFLTGQRRQGLDVVHFVMTQSSIDRERVDEDKLVVAR